MEEVVASIRPATTQAEAVEAAGELPIRSCFLPAIFLQLLLSLLGPEELEELSKGR